MNCVVVLAHPGTYNNQVALNVWPYITENINENPAFLSVLVTAEESKQIFLWLFFSLSTKLLITRDCIIPLI